MKKIIIFIIITLSFPLLALADSEVSLEETLGEIKKSQNIERLEDIDCAKVTDSQFEALGDAYMEVMHPGEQHELMDRMMGGEGSESLSAMHTLMGKNYLNCDNRTAGTYGGMMGMMSGGMMSGMMGSWSNPSTLTNNSNNPMMNFGFTPFGWFGWIFMILFWGLIILGIMALIRTLTKGGESNKKTPLDILKERYVKGEIDQKEYDTKKKELEK